MKTIDQLTNTEKSLLLFLECAAVDHAGLYSPGSINAKERALMDTWMAEGFIKHGRVASEWLKEGRTSWVYLSAEAFKLAHVVREARALRKWRSKTYETTCELRAAGPEMDQVSQNLDDTQLSAPACSAFGLYRPDGSLSRVILCESLSEEQEDNILSSAWKDLQPENDFRSGIPRPEAENKAKAAGWCVVPVTILPNIKVDDLAPKVDAVYKNSG